MQFPTAPPEVCGSCRNLLEFEGELLSGEGDDSLARRLDSHEFWRVCESVPAAEDDPVVEPHKEVGTGDL